MSLLHHIIIASLVAFAATQDCPGDFFLSGSNCYSVYDLQGFNMTWEECRTICQAMEGGTLDTDLATFANAEELETFSITWLTESANYPADPYMWIGVQKVGDVWQTVDGDTVGFQNLMWHESHPHSMGVSVFLQDITLVTGVESYGRLYYTCSMGMYEHHSRCLCQAK